MDVDIIIIVIDTSRASTSRELNLHSQLEILELGYQERTRHLFCDVNNNCARSEIRVQASGARARVVAVFVSCSQKTRKLSLPDFNVR